MAYVTINEHGALTGFFQQEILPEHAAIAIEANGVSALDWPQYAANEDRTGLVLAAAVVTAPSLDDYKAAIQSMLDAAAQAHAYDDIKSACEYAGALDPQFDREGRACKNWRAAVWRAAIDIWTAVEAKTMPVPSVPELLQALPVLVWPVAP